MFKPIKYLIDWRPGTKLVEGFAFETPGWPEFHACVRYGNRSGDSLFDDWIIDQFETGLAVSEAGRLKCKEDAPAALAKVLRKVGKKGVREALRKKGVLP